MNKRSKFFRIVLWAHSTTNVLIDLPDMTWNKSINPMALSTAQRNFSQKQLGTELQKNECLYTYNIVYLLRAFFLILPLCIIFKRKTFLGHKFICCLWIYPSIAIYFRWVNIPYSPILQITQLFCSFLYQQYQNVGLVQKVFVF